MVRYHRHIGVQERVGVLRRLRFLGRLVSNGRIFLLDALFDGNESDFIAGIRKKASK